jgi:hypothetical protein
MWAVIWKYTKKFWWVLALIGVAFYAWLRAQLREAERAAVLRQQLEIERRFREQIRNSENISRDQRRQYELEVEVGRAAVEAKKRELDVQVAADANALADAWNRSFGPRREPPTPPAP